MRATLEKIRRGQLDASLTSLSGGVLPVRPVDGWLRSVREALGMSLEVFGRRLGMSKQSARAMEVAERDESITIKRLRRAAAALGCEVHIVLVPVLPLEDQVAASAYAAARSEVERVQHLMVLEDQALYDDQLDAMTQDIASEMIRTSDPRIWRS